ncbi:MAG: group II intron reverse transcriptase/maturase [Proteobacteria bacterium]|nr:group II intron reverse transcriptase/maturase [Pseudomonadota bacterium]
MRNTKGTQGPSSVLTKQQRIAEAARQYPEASLTSLNHYMDMDWMREAYRRVRKDSAPGYDRQTVGEYGENLQENLSSLLEQAKSGTYVAPPVRRVYIPKGAGTKETRPIGVPTTEDKVLQRAVLMLLEPIYEQEFYDFSFGFRPKCSAHQALEYIWHQVMSQRIVWILDVDIRKFFDTLDKAKLREMFRCRVRDGVVTRLIGKWLKAGVLEAGNIWYPERGTPQGGVVSPLLSNIYLHEVLDRWFAEMVKQRLKGRSFMARFADDCVMGFEYRQDADRVMKVLPQRLGKYGLSLHPEKTRIVPFARLHRVSTGGKGGPGTFDFLGFTHYWGKSRKGNWILKRKTARDRFSRGLKRMREWCQLNRHKSMGEQHETLCRKLEGHYAYYGITGNGPWLERFREEVKKIWHFWLNRRSRKRDDLPWERFTVLERCFFPFPYARVVHSIYVAKP